MKRLALLAAIVLTGCGGGGAGARGDAVIERVVDGDTIRLGDGRTVRLVQIDAPESDDGECFGREATEELRRLLGDGARVTLARDARLDDRDRFGRLLRYVGVGGRNINVELVRRGAAAPYFFRGDRGRHADELLRAAQEARRDRRGLWGACPRTRLDPDRAVEAL